MTITSLLPFLKPRTNSVTGHAMSFDEYCLRKKAYGNSLRGLHRELFSAVADTLEICARKLGLMYKGALELDSMEEIAFITDYAIYDYRIHGRNGVERCTDRISHAGGDPLRANVLKAMHSTHFSVFECTNIEVHRPALILNDLLWGGEMEVVDIALHQCLETGALLAGRVLTLPEFKMFSGIVTPVDLEMLNVALARAANMKKLLRGPSLEDRANLTASIIRMAARAGYTSQVAGSN